MHVIAAKRGDGLRPELINALKYEHLLDGVAVPTEGSATVCLETLDTRDATHSEARKSDATAK